MDLESNRHFYCYILFQIIDFLVAEEINNLVAVS